MVPAHAPLPTDWSLPFQPDAGNHTSILMSESLVGVSVAATRQNSGNCANGFEPPRPPPALPAGGVNCPAATVRASVTAALGCPHDMRLSHDAALARTGAR